MDSNFEQESKEKYPIEVTVDGIATVVRFLHLQKAYDPIDVILPLNSIIATESQ